MSPHVHHLTSPVPQLLLTCISYSSRAFPIFCLFVPSAISIFAFVLCVFQLTAALERLSTLEGQMYGEVSLEAGNILRFAKAAPFQGRLLALREVRDAYAIVVVLLLLFCCCSGVLYLLFFNPPADWPKEEKKKKRKS